MSGKKKTSVLLIYTGGTIGMKTDPQTGALAPFDFNDIYEEFPNLKYLDADIEVMPFTPIDSSNVTPDLWIRLAEIIRDRYDDFDGFVVLHGTDTMSYSSSALSFMLDNLDKPVVFTGSQIPIGVMRSDGRENFITAIEIAAQKENGKAKVPEVCLYFQNKLFRANRTTKFSSEDLSAFRSDNFPPLAHVGVNIVYNTPYIHQPERKTDSLKIHTSVDQNVMVIRIFPGMTKDLFESLLSTKNIRGIVLETYGSGNAPTSEWFIDALKKAIDNNIIIMNVTQCNSGSVSMELYDTGVRLQSIGVISGYDITVEAAVTKMMYMLGKGLTYEETTKKLKEPLRGEITV